MADPYLRVHAVNVYVKDQARSLDFYLNTLGFHLAFPCDGDVGSRLASVNQVRPRAGRDEDSWDSAKRGARMHREEPR